MAGTAGAERRQRLPGDELVDSAALVTERAIDVAGEPEEVWPWLMQLGSADPGPGGDSPGIGADLRHCAMGPSGRPDCLLSVILTGRYGFEALSLVDAQAASQACALRTGRS